MENNQLVVQEKRGTLTLHNVSKYGAGAALAGALVASNANAAAQLDFAGATEELAGVQTSVVGIIGTLVVLIGIGIAWAYFKRTAK